MQHKWLALRSSQSVVGLFGIIFLLSSFSMHAMKHIRTDCSNDISLIDDVFSTTICPYLDRPARDALRCACTKYLKIVYSQDELNRNCEEACNKKDPHQIGYWRSLGGCYFYQEFAHAVKSKKGKLAAWLLKKDKVVVWDAYCSNIKQAVETSAVDEMVPVITWLLYTRRPTIRDSEYLSGYYVSNNLKEQYPEVQKFIDLFKDYYTQEAKRLEERVKSIVFRSSCGRPSSCERSCQARCGYH